MIDDKQRILQLVQTGRLQEARYLGERLCKRRKKDAEAWFLLGAIHGQLQAFDRAAECCRKAVGLQPAAPMAHFNLGVVLQKLGKLEEAAVHLREAIRLQPAMVEAHHELGNALQASGQLDDAISSYNRAIQLNPRLARVHCNLGSAQISRGLPEQAAASLRASIALDPGLAEAHYLLGNLLFDNGALEAAEKSYQQALQLDPAHCESHFKMGTVRERQNRLEEAVQCYERATELCPVLMAPCVNLGNTLSKLGRTGDAEAWFRKAIALQPDCAEAYYNLGNLYKEQEKPAEAEDAYLKALEIDADLDGAMNNLGLVYLEQVRLDESEALFRDLLSTHPDAEDPRLNLAKVLREKNDMKGAVAILEDVLARNPECVGAHQDRSVLRLAAGDFARGWPEYEWRLQGKDAPVCRYHYPVWDGGSLAGRTILVYVEQGIGDEIMFASCFPDLIERAGHVVIDCNSRLVSLFKRSFPAATVHGMQDDDAGSWLASAPRIDVQIAAGSVPQYLRPDRNSFPVHTGYLLASPDLRRKWRDRYALLGAGTKIGVSWRGGHESHTKRRRSTTLDQWAALLERQDAHFVNLQYGDCTEELRSVNHSPGTTIHDWDDADPLTDLDNFAAQIAELDLVISIDNSTVHMASALGVPTWLLQPLVPDWRWLLSGEGSYWYPAVRQFRQTAPGDWASVFEHVKIQLETR